MRAKSTTIIPQRKSVVRIAIIVGLILLIPLFGDLFAQGWHWDLSDFIVAGIVLFGTSLAIDFAARRITNPIYRLLAIAAIVLALLVVWVEMATDGISRTIISLF